MIFWYLFIFRILTLPQLGEASLLNQVEPTYQILTTPSSVKIEVSTKVSTDTLLSVEETRKRILKQEAEKDPLLAMAFIQKLAAEGDSQAQAIRALYQAYHHFFENPSYDLIQKICDQILQDETADSLSHAFAHYLQTLLKGQLLAPALEEARSLLNQLIPGIEQTLTRKLPQKVYAEQKVSIPEMQAPYRAFPDLIKYEGVYYACFREADSHVGYGDFGKIRILKGRFNDATQTWKWENSGLLSKEGYDLRDPRFFVNQEGALQMVIGGSKINEKNETILEVPHVAIFKNHEWSLFEALVDPTAKGPLGQWIWRVTWNPNDHKGYAFSYGKGSTLSLMQTADGLHFEKIADIAYPPLTHLSESTLRFKPDGRVIAFIRSQKNGIIGVATPQERYTKWSWNVIPFRVGGPNFLLSAHDQNMWAATRHYFLNPDNTLDEATIVGFMDEKSLIPALRLKSQFDNSYPGMVQEEDNSATVIYYSGESEQKANIYITRLKFPRIL